VILNVSVKGIQPAIIASIWHTWRHEGVTSSYAAGHSTQLPLSTASSNRFSISEISSQHLTNPHKQQITDSNGIQHAEMRLFSAGCSVKISSLSASTYGSWQWRIDVSGGQTQLSRCYPPLYLHTLSSNTSLSHTTAAADSRTAHTSVTKIINCKTHLYLFHFTKITTTLQCSSSSSSSNTTHEEKLKIFERKILRIIYRPVQDTNNEWKVRRNQEIDAVIK
jgi:hypothetical protein